MAGCPEGSNPLAVTADGPFNNAFHIRLAEQMFKQIVELRFGQLLQFRSAVLNIAHAGAEPMSAPVPVTLV